MRREAEDGATAEDATTRCAAGAHEADERGPSVELRALFQAQETLVNEVKKLNLGVLPVQCPPLCYKRAVTHDRARLSHAALLVSNECERNTKRLKREDKAGNEAFEGDALVVGAVLAEHDPIHKVVHIQTLVVDARHRRHGIGRLLIQRVIERAVECDRVECVQLHVHVANDDALAFYKTMGFIEHKRIENYYRHLTPRTCIVLRRSIDDANT